MFNQYLNLIEYGNVIRAAEKLQENYLKNVDKGLQCYYKPAKNTGWTISPSAVHAQLPYSSNSMGFRNTSQNETTNASKPTIAFFGDSLVHGDEVSDSETWVWMVQKHFQDKYHVINGGVSGYGTDQAFLRFQEMEECLSPKIAFLSYASTNLYRNINVERFFLYHRSELLFLKPRFIIKANKAQLVLPQETDFDNIVSVLRNDATRQFLSEYDSFFPRMSSQLVAKVVRKLGLSDVIPLDTAKRREALQVTYEIFKLFLEHCREHNIFGSILFLPTLWLKKNNSGEDFDWLIGALHKNGYHFLDLRSAFQFMDQHSLSDVRCPQNHYTSLSGQWCANAICEYIRNV